MRQLTGLEQAFLSLEGPTTSAVIACLARFDTPEEGQPVPDEPFMRARIDERLPYIPPFTKRIVEVPLGLDHSYLAECDRVDVERHLRTVRLPAPGDERALAAQISRIMSTDLVTGGPMWEYIVVEGLADGGVAHLLRTHHALADGSTMLHIWNTLSDDPNNPLPDTAPVRTLPQPLLGKTEMAARAAIGLAKKPVQLVKLEYELLNWAGSRYETEGLWAAPGFVASMLPGKLGHDLTSLINKRLRARGAPEITQYTKTYGTGPETAFNGRTSARRAYVFDEVPFAEIKDLSKRAGTTINNTGVAIVAGALRRLMEDFGPSPTEPIVASCPVSLREENGTDQWGNHVHMILADLPVHLDDPLQRLRHITETLVAERTSLDSMPAHLTNDVSSLLPRELYGLIVKIWTRMPDSLARPPWNVVVSNLRGPKRPDTVNGLRVCGYWPVSLLSIGGGINISFQSYVDRFCIGVVGAPDKTGDLWPLIGYLKDAQHELNEALQAAPGADR